MGTFLTRSFLATSLEQGFSRWAATSRVASSADNSSQTINVWIQLRCVKNYYPTYDHLLTG